MLRLIRKMAIFALFCLLFPIRAAGDSKGLGLDFALRIGFKPNFMNLSSTLQEEDSRRLAIANSSDNGVITDTLETTSAADDVKYTAYNYSRFSTANALSLGTDITWHFTRHFGLRTGAEYNMQLTGKSGKQDSTLQAGTTLIQEKNIKATTMLAPLLLTIGAENSLGRFYTGAGALFGQATVDYNITKSGTSLTATDDTYGEVKYKGSGIGFRGILGFQTPIVAGISVGFEYTIDLLSVNSKADGFLSTETDKKLDDEALKDANKFLNDASGNTQYISGSATRSSFGNAGLNMGGQTFHLRVIYSL